LAFVGDYLILATQTGVYVSEAGMPKKLTRIEELGDRKFKQVLALDADSVLLVREGGPLYRFNPVLGISSLEEIDCQDLPVQQAVCKSDGSLVIVTKTSVLHQQNGNWLDITPGEPIGGLHATSSSGGLLVWDMVEAWFQSPTDGGWRTVDGWKEEIKQAAIALDGSEVLATDRAFIYRFPLS
jgi:hypothetical protein